MKAQHATPSATPVGPSAYWQSTQRTTEKTQPNPTGALQINRAAEQGNAVARCNLASMYFLGIGVEQNFEQALTLYAMSAEQGNAVAIAKVN